MVFLQQQMILVFLQNIYNQTVQQKFLNLIKIIIFLMMKIILDLLIFTLIMKILNNIQIFSLMRLYNQEQINQQLKWRKFNFKQNINFNKMYLIQEERLSLCK
ncbi:hypothetical protein IMG5_172470 [Ichthyophthirius multifiliis]|uniref:Transmembrane protein n=1 Tax=Ichthyophthirius multifiliis TaxID=5932 RepID=G0R1S2_ICHMU|nr:hypothetical protein IMG5_172470 [Ichthyophthirius multifiliis]EGR28574.1 hypothetical protein IMG5_172470 [Ichthyophthirius multifiliis]|eukprot:XP_004029810.1 hypothetical protein IMG5_172470 [Ichthyophthirius multifiliis]